MDSNTNNSLFNNQNVQDILLNSNSSFITMVNNYINQALDEQILQAGINQSLTDTVNTKNNNISLNIESVKYSTLNNREENEKCPICIQNFKDDDDVWFDCHVFHFSCLEESVKYKPECPICRKNIDVISALEVSTDIEQCEECGENYLSEEGHVCEEVISEDETSIEEELSSE